MVFAPSRRRKSAPEKAMDILLSPVECGATAGLQRHGWVLASDRSGDFVRRRSANVARFFQPPRAGFRRACRRLRTSSAWKRRTPSATRRRRRPIALVQSCFRAWPPAATGRFSMSPFMSQATKSSSNSNRPRPAGRRRRSISWGMVDRIAIPTLFGAPEKLQGVPGGALACRGPPPRAGRHRLLQWAIGGRRRREQAPGNGA